MIKYKDSKKTINFAKRTITISNVTIKDGLFVDEDGNIANRLSELLISPVDGINMSIKFELPEKE